MTAARGKWIDQSISHNVFMRGVSGKMLNDIYIAAWQAGLKTIYYLRTLGASQIEKSSLDANKFGFTQKRVYKTVEDMAAPAAGASKMLLHQMMILLRVRHAVYRMILDVKCVNKLTSYYISFRMGDPKKH